MSERPRYIRVYNTKNETVVEVMKQYFDSDVRLAYRKVNASTWAGLAQAVGIVTRELFTEYMLSEEQKKDAESKREAGKKAGKEERN